VALPKYIRRMHEGKVWVSNMRNQEISVKLNLSEHTVRNYLLRIFDKLGISSRVELVLYAFSGVEGIAPPPLSGVGAREA
jgi:two-component system nitrate/nitrite response regulator NarL